MKIKIELEQKLFEVDLSKGYDISIPLIDGTDGPNCFHAPLFEIAPLTSGSFIGDTRKGSPVNFYNVRLNPHGNGTHTECVGHIAQERISINDVLKNSHFMANLVSVYPVLMDNGDRIITLALLKEILDGLATVDALIIRTMPNHSDKKTRNYSGNNPPYFEPQAISYILEKGYKHLLTDLPSIDREEDEGMVVGHKLFWNYPSEINLERTITELIYVDDDIKDGNYFINIHIPPFVLDAAPSRVFLYSLDAAF